MFYSRYTKEKLMNNIENRINKFSKWKTANSNDLSEWLVKKLKRTIP